MPSYLITTHEVIETEGETPATVTPSQRPADLSAVRRQIQFVRGALANGYLDFDSLDECDEALGKALRDLDAYEKGGAR